MKAYSNDLRERIIRAIEQGESRPKVAKRFRVSLRTVERYWKLKNESGSFEAKKVGGKRPSRLQGHDQTLKEWIKKEPDLTLVELQERCKDQLKISVSHVGIWLRLKRLGLSFKKNAARRRARST